MKIKSIFALLMAMGVAAPLFAQEVFLDVLFENKAESLYRIKTDNEHSKPIGLYNENITENIGYYIDNVRNHRFIKLDDNASDTYSAATQPIYRQIFDGAILEADRGRAGNASCSDEREAAVPGEKGKGVYRTEGAVYSAGLGEKTDEAVARKNLLNGEYESVEGKNWYKIPNGSWYQSYSHSSDKKSYDIVFDRWDEKIQSIRDEYWRGEPLGRALEKPLGIFSDKKLLRASVDGALEKLSDGALKTVAESKGNYTFFILPERKNRDSKIGCYTWNGTGEGDFYILGNREEIKPVFESLDSEHRFVCCGTAITGVRKYYVLGTDILGQWLKTGGLNNSEAECSNVAAIPLEKTLKSLIYVYSEPENKLYRFIIDEEKEVSVGLPKQIELDFKVSAMTLDTDGTLYLSSALSEASKPEGQNVDGLVMETCSILNNNIPVASESTPVKDGEVPAPETKEDYETRVKRANSITCDADCVAILSRTHYINFYELSFGSSEIQKIDYKVFCGKEYFGLPMTFKGIIVAKLDADLVSLMQEAKKPGNSIGVITDDAPGFPDSFNRPVRCRLAISPKR